MSNLSLGCVATADFNGDGKPDLICSGGSDLSGNTTNVLTLFTNNGSGSLVFSGIVHVDCGALWVQAADFTGDGKMDVASTDQGCGANKTVTICTNTGSGTLASNATYTVAGSGYHFVAADINGDNKQDLVVATYRITAESLFSFSVLTNNGSGRFSPSFTNSDNFYAHSVAVADFNGDGKPDIAVAYYTYGQVCIYTNSGSGRFAKAGFVSVAGASSFVVAGDFNADGKQDLAVGDSNNGNGVAILTNSGNANFTLQAYYAPGSNPSSLTAIDVNGDGKIDIITANQNNANVGVWTNNASGGFALQTNLPCGFSPRMTSWTDFNGDGVPDVAICNGTNSVTVYFGSSGTRPQALQIITNFALPNYCGNIGVNPNLNKIYLTGGASSAQPIVIVDGSTFSLSTAGTGMGVDVDVTNNNYWSAGVYSDNVTVWNSSNVALTNNATGCGCATGTTIDAPNRRVWATAQCCDAFWVFSADSPYSLISGPISPGGVIGTYCINSGTGRAYFESSGLHKRITPPGFGVTTTSLGLVIGANPRSNRLYAQGAGGTLQIINGATDPELVITNVTLPFQVNGGRIAVNPALNQVYIGNTSNAIYSVDGDTGSVLGTAFGDPSISFSGNMAADATRNRVYAIGYITGTPYLYVLQVSSAVASNIPPIVNITSPADGTTFITPANVNIVTDASDLDGTVAQVMFLSGTNQIGLRTNAPFSFLWTNAPVGTNFLTAIATDNGGLSTTSATVRVIVTQPPPPVFTLSTNAYSVSKNGGSVVVTILKSANSLGGTINYNTSGGSAIPQNDPIPGNYLTVSGSIDFKSTDTSTNVSIPIISNPVYEGNTTFTFELHASGVSSTVGNPGTATITILEVNSPSTTNSVLNYGFPAAVPPHSGLLSISTQPDYAFGQWRLSWETAWRNSGELISGLPSGSYPIEFKPVSGFIPPPPVTNYVVSGSTVATTYQYVRTPSDLAFGSISVYTQPPQAAGQWQFQGENIWRNSGDIVSNLLVGDYIVVFKDAAGWVTPPGRAVVVSQNQLSSIGATYVAAQGSTGAAAPQALTFNDATTASAAYPWAYNGQLFSDVGYGSGFVVKKRVVLTAAHMVFNDANLSYVPTIYWFFQRYSGTYEPPPQVPHGWYTYSGYAAARTNDNSPGVESPASQNLDVAALYFLTDAGRGGYSGYLTSNPGATEWLQFPALKTLVGYPVDQVPVKGRMYKTDPGLRNFSLVTNRVFSTADLIGYAGNSGGAIWVQYTNNVYYPAAVYLGGDSGQSIVRAIDGGVADVINRAEISSYTGANHAGGGVVLLNSTAASSSFPYGYFQVTINPPEAADAGAGWRLLELTNTSTYYNDNSTYGIVASTYTLAFHAVSNYMAPSSRLLTVNVNQTNAIAVNYVNLQPKAASLQINNGFATLAFTNAAAGQKYAIDISTNLPTWLPLVTNQILSDGTLRFTNAVNSSRSFYRARYVP